MARSDEHHSVKQGRNGAGSPRTGALVGGYLATLLGIGAVTGFNPGSLAIATGCAILLLLVRRWLRASARPHRTTQILLENAALLDVERGERRPTGRSK